MQVLSLLRHLPFGDTLRWPTGFSNEHDYCSSPHCDDAHRRHPSFGEHGT